MTVVVHFSKLVRDRIPEILEQQSIEFGMHQCENREKFHGLLAHKLVEEAREYLYSKDPNELADIMELVDELLRYHGTSLDQLRSMQMEKRESRGGYENRIVLDWIREE